MGGLPKRDFVKGSHCGFCGSKFVEQVLYPRKCWTCHNDTWANPLPVVVAMIKVFDDNGDVGALIQKRDIEPKKGEWALPGGYINLGETWREALAREIKEEMGMDTNPGDYAEFSVHMGSQNNTILIFAEYLFDFMWDEIHFTPNEEVSAIRMVSDSEELAFSSHTLNLANYLDVI